MAEVTTESEIQRLREQLLAFVVAEASASLTEKADMPLPAALAAAIDAKVNAAVTRSVGENVPSAEALSAQILEAVRAKLPQLTEGDAPPKRGGRKGADSVFGNADDSGNAPPPPPPGNDGTVDTGLGFRLNTTRLIGFTVIVFLFGLALGWVVHGMTSPRSNEPPKLEMNATDNGADASPPTGDGEDANAAKTPEDQAEPKAEDSRPATATLVNSTAAAPTRDRGARDNTRPPSAAATTTPANRPARDPAAGDGTANAPPGAVNTPPAGG